jgi:hypothetical protein
VEASGVGLPQQFEERPRVLEKYYFSVESLQPNLTDVSASQQ